MISPPKFHSREDLMKRATSITLLVALWIVPIVRAADEDDKDKTIAELKAKIASLEKRVETLERLLGPLQAQAQQKVLREEFEKRMAQDQKKYKPDQIREAEQLYQTMNKDFASPGGKAALEALIKKYPDINRTGCAELYLGQVTEGDDKVQHLQTAIDQYSDCM